MANLKDLRTRITSVSSTMQITSAMKMVSAAKLKRAQDAIVQMRPYSQKLTLIMGNVSSVADSSENLFFKKRKECLRWLSSRLVFLVFECSVKVCVKKLL